MKSSSVCNFCPAIFAFPCTLFIAVTFSGPGKLDAQEGWGNLKGKIVVTGKVAEPSALKITKDQPFCTKDGNRIVDESLMVGKEGELVNAFVMMYLDRRDKREVPIHESYLTQKKEKKVVLDNKLCRFVPHAQFVQKGQVLTMKNSDDVGHNCHIVSLRNEKNVNLPAHEEVDVKFEENDRAPSLVKCDIHPWMAGIVLIRENPYVSITGKDGAFEIKNIPAGEWSFQFWHERVGYMKSLQRDGKKFLGQLRGEIKLNIEPGKTIDLGKLTFSAEDFKPAN